jgi:hypothetical protein
VQYFPVSYCGGPTCAAASDEAPTTMPSTETKNFTDADISTSFDGLNSIGGEVRQTA